MFKALAADAGLPPIRHTRPAARRRLARAIGRHGPEVVQDVLGHSSIVLTADTYTSVLPDIARKAAAPAASSSSAAGSAGAGRPGESVTGPEFIHHC